MRSISIIIVAAAMVGLGCSHASQKAETKAPAPAKAAPQKEAEKAAPASSSTKVECSIKGDSRTLEVREKGKGCELGYTKAGKEGIVASASHGKDYCDKAMEKLEEKLKGAGYNCK